MIFSPKLVALGLILGQVTLVARIPNLEVDVAAPEKNNNPSKHLAYPPIHTLQFLCIR
jgi:hypothetical protein